MTTRISVEPQQDGTQIWTNQDDETSEEIRYVFAPVASLRAGDRIEDMESYRRRPNGRGLEKVTEAGKGALSVPEIAAFPAGSFVRMRAAAPRVAQGDRSKQT